MTLRHFQVFVEVCNQGTMSAAAKKLFITQSAISQIIKDMEKHYGVVLFRRKSHKLYLTEAGKKLYSHAIKMVQYNEHIESSMADARKTMPLRIGSISAVIMIDVISEYKRLHPEIAVSMVHHARSVLDMLLYSSQLDVAIVSGLFNISDYDNYPLTTFDIIFACRKDTRLSPLLEGDCPSLTLEELSSFPLYVCAVNEDVEQSLSTAFLEHGMHYNVAGTFLDYEGLIEAAMQDFGIILINTTMFEISRQELKQIQVEGMEIKNKISLVCSKENSSNPDIRRFIDFAVSHFEAVRNSRSEKRYPLY